MSDENVVEKIDLNKVDWRGSREFFESLGESLDRLDDKDESYDFTWVGKRKAIIEAGTPINKTFRPDIEASKNWDATENLFIEGDNLDALKLLQESYLGKVKMIYIDPPYNTGKDFVYRDNFKASVEDYDEDTEHKDEAGNIQFKKNEKTNGRYHSDWLSMMYPRLKLAQNLLAEDGVIFISIDDNEQANLKKLCDEIFGEDNFLNTIVWYYQNSTMKNPSDKLAKTHEYILMYRKTPMFEPYKVRYGEVSENLIKRFGKYADADSNIKLKSVKHEESYLSRIVPKFRKLHGRDPEDEDVIDTLLPNYLRDVIEMPTTRTNDLKSQFDLDFDNPKNFKLIQLLAELATTPKEGDISNDLVLDFFSGSATTAHAIMHLNAQDGGNRKWIMVQLPELIDVKSEAYRASYETIAEISRERIRRAGDKIAQEYPNAETDYGFRSFTVADTNYREVYKAASEQEQSTLLDVVDNIKDDRSDLDLLYGVLTQSALELNRSLTSKELGGSHVFMYDYSGEVSGLIACFSQNIPEAAIQDIAKLKPLTAVFRDASFATSQDKVNLAEHFRTISPDTKVKVI